MACNKKAKATALSFSGRGPFPADVPGPGPGGGTAAWPTHSRTHGGVDDQEHSRNKLNVSNGAVPAAAREEKPNSGEGGGIDIERYDRGGGGGGGQGRKLHRRCVQFS